MLHLLRDLIRDVRLHSTLLGLLIVLGVIAAGLSLSSVNVLATGQNAPELEIQRAISQLADPQLTPARHQAQQQLERAGETGVQALVASLRSSNPVLRRNSVELLGYIGSARAVEPLREALAGDTDPAVRREAAVSLGALDRVDMAPALERAAVLDVDATVRKAAADALVALQFNLADRARVDERSVRAFAVAPNRPNVVYLADQDRVAISRDGGKTWRPAGQMQSSIMSLAVSPADANVVYVGTESLGLFKSGDGGATWAAVNKSLGEEPGMPVGAAALAIDPNDPNRIFVAKGVWIGTSQARLFPRGVLMSADGGQTWQVVGFSANDSITRLYTNGNTVYGVSGDRVLAAKF